MTDTWRHQRDVVANLHQAHADYIESTYSGLASVPGNPHQIALKRIDGVRIFHSSTNSYTNRAIFTGLESPATVQAVIDYIQQVGLDFFIEVNPANFHPDDPKQWRSPLLKMLLAAGFWPGAFRCAWRYSGEKVRIALPDNFRIETIRHDQLTSKVDAILEASATQPEDADEIKMHLQGESAEGWIHYVGYENDVPCATATLFVNGDFSYLAWGYTRPNYRGRGYHHAMIRQRVADAQAAGCTTIFSVSDFTNPSGLNLQACGFRLAYNYLMLNSAPIV